MDSALWAGLGCVAGVMIPVAVGFVFLTWSKAELTAMLRQWLDRR